MLLSNKQLFLESESPNPEELGETTPTTTSANMNDFAGNDPVLPGQPLIQQ
jgi:hypothetical protein